MCVHPQNLSNQASEPDSPFQSRIYPRCSKKSFSLMLTEMPYLYQSSLLCWFGTLSVSAAGSTLRTCILQFGQSKYLAQISRGLTDFPELGECVITRCCLHNSHYNNGGCEYKWSTFWLSIRISCCPLQAWLDSSSVDGLKHVQITQEMLMDIEKSVVKLQTTASV